MIALTELLKMVKDKKIQAIIGNDTVQFYEIVDDNRLCGFSEEKQDFYPYYNSRYLLADVLEILGFKVDYP